jgi:hypothetical protein
VQAGDVNGHEDDGPHQFAEMSENKPCINNQADSKKEGSLEGERSRKPDFLDAQVLSLADIATFVGFVIIVRVPCS